jgi:hypothetical protein
MTRTRLSVGVAVALSIFCVLALAGTALAYGAADQPLAQIELSGNCNNPDYPLCAPPPAGVGTGGIWLWIEIDAVNNTGDVAGAGCGHVVGGVGGPGGAGAGSIKGDVTWRYVTLAEGTAAGGGFFGTFDPGDKYYLVTLPTGEMLLFPTTTGHYSFQPARAVTLQLQVAP